MSPHIVVREPATLSAALDEAEKELRYKRVIHMVATWQRNLYGPDDALVYYTRKGRHEEDAGDTEAGLERASRVL